MEYINDYMSPDDNYFMNASEDVIVDENYVTNRLGFEATGGKMTRAWAFIKNLLRKLSTLIQDWWNKQAIAKLKSVLRSKVVPYSYDDQMKILKQAVDNAKSKSKKGSQSSNNGTDESSILADTAFAIIFTMRDADIITKLKAMYTTMKGINVKNMNKEINGFVDLVGVDTVKAFREPIFGRTGGILNIDLSALSLAANKSVDDGRVDDAKAAGDQAANAKRQEMQDYNNKNAAKVNTNTPVQKAKQKFTTGSSRTNPNKNATKMNYSNNATDSASQAAGQHAMNKYLGSQLTNNDVESIGQGLTLVINIYSQLITKTAWFIDRLEKSGRGNPKLILQLMKEVQSRLYAIIRVCTSMVTDVDTDNGNYKENDASDNGADGSVAPDTPQPDVKSTGTPIQVQQPQKQNP